MVPSAFGHLPPPTKAAPHCTPAGLSWRENVALLGRDSKTLGVECQAEQGTRLSPSPCLFPHGRGRIPPSPPGKVQKSCQSPTTDLRGARRQALFTLAPSRHSLAGKSSTVRFAQRRRRDADGPVSRTSYFDFFPQGGKQAGGGQNGLSGVSETALQSRDGRQRQARPDPPSLKGAVPGSTTRVY